MIQIAYILILTVRALVGVLEFLMLARAILSWLPVGEDSPVENFLYTVTEPVIMPVRSLCERFGWFDGLPIDMPFFITFIILSVLGAIL